MGGGSDSPQLYRVGSVGQVSDLNQRDPSDALLTRSLSPFAVSAKIYSWHNPDLKPAFPNRNAPITFVTSQPRLFIALHEFGTENDTGMLRP